MKCDPSTHKSNSLCLLLLLTVCWELLAAQGPAPAFYDLDQFAERSFVTLSFLCPPHFFSLPHIALDHCFSTITWLLFGNGE